MSVPKRQLGDSDLEVTSISLGSWLTYGHGVERDQTAACTRAAFEAGINFFDTANVYGVGAAEEAWGEVLSGYTREDYILATKVYFPMSDSDAGLSAEQIAKQIDASLKRLQTDYVDLYQCHRFDTNVAIEETMEALGKVVESGKARYIGFSEWTPEQIQAGLDVAGAPKFVSSQPQYNAIWRSPEAELFGLCRDNNISQIVWSPLAQGVLSGKYKPGEPHPPDSRAAKDDVSWAIDRYMEDDVLNAVQSLVPIAEKVGIPMQQLALAWILRREEVASAIIGATKPEHVHSNAAAGEIDLDEWTITAIDEALAEVAITEPRLAGFANEGVKHR